MLFYRDCMSTACFYLITASEKETQNLCSIDGQYVGKTVAVYKPKFTSLIHGVAVMDTDSALLIIAPNWSNFVLRDVMDFE